MDEDDVDFSAPGSTRSRLSSLFQSENPPGGDVNQALTFTAPKQPKKNDNTQVASGALKLIYAVAVHAYKLKDGNYANQGKLGCAVLGHHEACNYKLLLYKGKQIPVNVVSITPNFIFHVQPNNYANFYDEKKENWSINFDSESALFDFSKQVALAKANSQGKSPTSLVTQDLVKGDGQPLDNGDTTEVKYTGWLLSGFTFGQVFDSNMNSDSLFRVRLGKGKVIKGWNDGLIGMQKGGKRILIIPADLAYGSEGMGSAVPPNSSLIFEIHVIKIKVARESSHSPSPVKPPENVADKKPDVPPRQSFSHDDNIRMRGASISEQLTQSPKKDKAQLISRMAKMGTATLPFQGAIAAQVVSSDSESEVEPPQPSSPAPQNISRTSSPKAFSKPRSRTNSGPTAPTPPVQPQPIAASLPFHVSQPSSQMSLYAQSAMPSQQPFVCAATPFPTYPPAMPGQFALPQTPYSMHNVPGLIPPVTTSISDSHLSLLISETRTQSTEVRMSLSKITDKVDSVIQKVDDLRLQGKSTPTGMPFMESTIILQNIERIIQENTRLKEDVEAKNSKIQSLNEKICDIFQRNQRFFEESNSMLEQKTDTLQTASAHSQEKILTLEQEKAKLQLDLSTTTIKLNTLESDVIRFQKLEIELSQKLQEAEKEILKQVNLLNDAKAQMNESQMQTSALQEKLKSVEQENSTLSGKVQNMEEMLNSSQGSSDLVEMYKKEIQEYKEKVEQLNSIVKDNISSEKLKEENEKIKLEFDKNVKLLNDIQLVADKNEKKVNAFEKQRISYEEKIQRLEAEIEVYQVLKRKYEVFQERTRALKETYEKQILELTNEVKRLQSTKSVATSPEFSVEIKRVMNRLYKILQGKFESDSSYNGSNVLENVLQAIMALTFQVLESKNQLPEDQSLTEPSKKEVISEQETSHSEEKSQSDFSQQNGVNEPPAEAANSECFANPVSSDIGKTSGISGSELDGERVSKESAETRDEVKSETSVNSETEKDVNSKAEQKEQAGETIKRESPETWRPQPPPLFDDDDDDDDDDDWLK